MKRSIKKSIYDFSIENNLPHILQEYKGTVDAKDIRSLADILMLLAYTDKEAL